MKSWYFILMLTISSTNLLSQSMLKKDTAYIAARSFNANTLKQLKGEKDFQYNQSREPALSLWGKFWKGFWWKIGQLLSTRSGRITFQSILVLAGIAVIVYFIVKITGMDQGSLFGRSGKDLRQYNLSENDIHRVAFDQAIEKAINDGNYRLATRLQYLQALKKLADKGYINWRINKTNSDYLGEVKGKPFSNMFTRLTADFEYTWYGEKQVSKDQFLEIRSQFQQFNKQMQ